tara:strand:- start:115 stop:558 length:444 start_codon:yes stop_codon:yes gene_type:complete
MSKFSKSECLWQHYNGYNGESLNSALGNKPRKNKKIKNKKIKNKENQPIDNQTPVWIEKHSTPYSTPYSTSFQNILLESNGYNVQSRINKLEEQLDNMAFVVINQSKEITGLRNVLNAKAPEQTEQNSLKKQILESSFFNETKNRTI